jgi:hypothetical protein
MRLLLLFLFCYFAYRYGRYIYNKFVVKNTPQQPKQTVYQNSPPPSSATSTKKNDGDDGEYVEFEEIKE